MATRWRSSSGASEMRQRDNDRNDTELKAGTESKQHAVGVTPAVEGTEFGLVYLEQNSPK